MARGIKAHREEPREQEENYRACFRDFLLTSDRGEWYCFIDSGRGFQGRRKLLVAPVLNSCFVVTTGNRI